MCSGKCDMCTCRANDLVFVDGSSLPFEEFLHSTEDEQDTMLCGLSEASMSKTADLMADRL